MLIYRKPDCDSIELSASLVGSSAYKLRILLILPHRLDKNFCQLGTRVLGRRCLAGAE